MKVNEVDRILSDTAYVRVSGTPDEVRCAEYLHDICAQMGLDAKIEKFSLTMFNEDKAELFADGKRINCKSYFGCGCGTVKAELYYLVDDEPYSLEKCKNKIVLSEMPVNSKLYEKLVDNGAVGFITYNGDVEIPDKDIIRKELRFHIEADKKIPGVNIHAKDAVALVKSRSKSIEMTVEQTCYEGSSQNIVLDLLGDTDETVTITAHYDSTSLSLGAYDNMSGSIALLYLAEYFAKKHHRRGLRLMWCGSEERGLIGSLEYCKSHKAELENCILNINLDMLGTVMGKFVSICTADEKMVDYVKAFLSDKRISSTVNHAIRSSDSNSFALYGVPSVSFVRYAPGSIAKIHTRYDTSDVLDPQRIIDDADVVAKFTEIALNASDFPTEKGISDKIKEDVDTYFSNFSRILNR